MVTVRQLIDRKIFVRLWKGLLRLNYQPVSMLGVPVLIRAFLCSLLLARYFQRRLVMDTGLVSDGTEKFSLYIVVLTIQKMRSRLEIQPYTMA